MRVTHITPDDNEVNQADWAADHVIVTDTGWANYSHTGGAQAISANTRTQLTIDGGSKIDGQLPEGIAALWSNNAITGINGDDRSGRIKFTVTPQDGACSYIDLEFDIGSVIDEQRFPISVGALVAKKISLPFELYCGATFEANGCKLYVTSDGPISISAKSILIKRSHAARS